MTIIPHNLKDKILGDYDTNKVSGLHPDWFLTCRISLIDFRGDLQIRSAMNITFGFHVTILTASHDFSQGSLGEMILKKVWIDEGAFIGSNALLYNCHIGQCAVVAAGAVVRNIKVPPHCMVEGNPATVTKVFKDGQWVAPYFWKEIK